MKSPNEICKIVGISPKALCEYIDQGLVTPTAIDENGYQHFDDDVIRKVSLAALFSGAGYTREQIMAIFDFDNKALVKEYGKLFNMLDEQQGKTETQFSEYTLKILSNISTPDTYLGSFKY